MFIDANTVFFLVMATCFLVGVMLLLAWEHNRREIAYLWWAGGFSSAAVGLSLISLQAGNGGRLSLGFGTMLVLLGLTLCWGGARTFDRRPITAWPVAIGVLSWSIINLVPAVEASAAARSAVMSCFLGFYSLAIGYEFWRGRGDDLASRKPLAILCFINGGIHAAGVVASFLPNPATGNADADLVFGTMLFQPALLLVAGGLYAIGLGRDRMEQELRRTATIDSLTGVLNRGALFQRGIELLDSARRNRRPLALLLFDLDRFKDINDTLGHLAGDLVLKSFARLAGNCLRAGDVIGRIGGEEFCIVLPNVSASVAQGIAERVRREFSANRFERDGVTIPATVSVGVVALEDGTSTFDDLLVLADRALYDAKRSGRDKVVTSALALAS